MRVEIALPAHNEEHALEANVRRLVAFLATGLPGADVSIAIADNGSTDSTPQIAARLARELPGVRAVHTEVAGKGLGIRTAWTASEADILAFMDVDLATGLESLPQLLEGLGDTYDLALGSRYLRGARAKRSLNRLLLSRAYVLLTGTLLGMNVTDTQCGFKAVTRQAAADLLPHIRDNSFFFDTELLFVARAKHYRIHEIPVAWSESDTSTVGLLRTTLRFLAGVARLSLRRTTACAAMATPPKDNP
jgi:glycosyltransferase involved in cell wall biosynthesis